MPITIELLTRTGELKRTLVKFGSKPRYARPFREMLAQNGIDRTEIEDRETWMGQMDHFLLRHRLRNGRSMVEQFVAVRPDLSEEDREILLGWQGLVDGPFEVLERDGASVVAVNLVDDLTYRIWTNAGPAAFQQVRKGYFLLASIVPLRDEWLISGPVRPVAPAQRDIIFELAVKIALKIPEAVYRNPAKLANAWETQRADRERFIRFFGSDLVILPGDQATARMREYWIFAQEDVLAGRPGTNTGESYPMAWEAPEAETICMIYDEVDGLCWCVDFAMVEDAYRDPDLLSGVGEHRAAVLGYLDGVLKPHVLRRLAERHPDEVSRVFELALNRPGFDWARDGEDLLRERKPGYFAREPRPGVSPISDRLGEYAARKARNPS